jgi:hypothetical protein
LKHPSGRSDLVGITAGLMVALIAYEAIRFSEGRDQVRHADRQTAPS